MDLLTAMLACSVYTSDDALVRAIADSNSHGNQYAVLDAAASTESDGPPPAEPKTVEAAMARLEEIRSNGGKPLLGWMQLPPDWLTMFGREMREAFDPCINVTIGTAMLSTFDYECSESAPDRRGAAQRPRRQSPRMRPMDRRACVVRKYGEALGMAEFGLVTTLQLRYQRSADGSTGASAPIEFMAGGRVWGADRILVPLATENARFDRPEDFSQR